MIEGLPATLATLASYAEIRGEAALALACRRASRDLEALDPRARGAAVRGADASAIPPEAAPVVRRVLDEGPDAVIEAEAGRIPRDLQRLLGLPGVSLADVLDVHRRFGAVTAGDLAAVAALAGHEATDREALALHHRLRDMLPALREGHPRIPLGRAVAIAEEATALLRLALPLEPPPTPLGSVRRFEPTVGDVELLLESETPDTTLSTAVDALSPADVLHRGRGIATLRLADEQLTLRAVRPGEAAFARLHYTGSAGHVRALQQRAADRGWRLTAAGLVSTTSQLEVPCRDEDEIYAHLGLAPIPPELRHGDDEIALAAGGARPELVRLEHVRGDLHTHTLWSDARDTVDTMVLTARTLGYEYVAITDHSPSTAASRVLTLDRLERQRDDIERVRRKVPGISVLHGVEVEILPDGSLDFPDRVLASLDVVVASLHDAAGQQPDRLLARYVAAMRHPHVHVITHPANRLVGRHEGYPLDYDALFAAAVETGTVVEVDGAPAHLDLDGHLARRAVAAGATLAIDSDCHNAARLGRQMRLGVGTARRGGVEARHVLNARPLADVLAFFAAKRERLGG